MVKKISIIGAGSVGSHVAFHCLWRFNPKELILVDILGSLAKGIALDLEDTRKFLGFTTEARGTSHFEHIKHSDIVVITAGQARKEGMTRYDLLKVNVKIVRAICSHIKKFASSSLILVVTNPVDFITYVVQKETGFSREKVMGVGSSLDAARFANFIYKATKINPLDINPLVIGLHSKDMIPLSRHSTLKQIPFERVLAMEKLNTLEERVKLRGKEIVDYLKRGSAFFAPSLTCAALLGAIINDRHELICVSTLLRGEYGVRNVCAGVPCIIGRKGITKIIEVSLNEEEKKKFLKVKDFFKECMTSL